MLDDPLQVHIPFTGVVELLPWREQEFERYPSPVGEPCRVVKDHTGRNEFRARILVDTIVRKTVSVERFIEVDDATVDKSEHYIGEDRLTQGGR